MKQQTKAVLSESTVHLIIIISLIVLAFAILTPIISKFASLFGS